MKKGACVLVLFSWLAVAVAPTAVWAQQKMAGPVEQTKTAEEDKEKEAQQTKKESTEEKAKQTEEQGADTVALEPVVVTGSRVEEPVSETTKSISVVTAKDRDDEQQYYIPELIDTVPGVFLRRLGGPGQWSNISIRGAGPQYTQFQYNGFPLRDAADTQSTLQYFIEDQFSGSNLQQVEILKGTQSTLYGSQAMGGVINIIPEKWKQGLGAEVRSEVGEHMTFIENGRAYYGSERFYLDIDPVFVHSDGDNNGGPNDYYYENLGFTAGAGVKFGYDMALEFSTVYYNTDLALSEITPSLDASGSVVKNLASDDEHREGLLGQYGLNFTHEVTTMWDYSLKGAYTETERHYFWSDTKGDQSNYDGDTSYLEMQHNIRPTKWLTVVAGADYELSHYDGQEPLNTAQGDYTPVYYKEHWYVWDMFGELQFKFLDESLFLNLGGRFNDHEKFDSETVGEASAAYLFKQFGTKIHGQVGSGYRTPSLYEIYGGYLYNGKSITIGNPDLIPEKSLGCEIGVDQQFFSGKLTLGFTWFHTDFEDMIVYDGWNNKYMNADKGKTEGFETYVNVAPVNWFNLALAYTYADPRYEDSDTGDWKREEYLPRNKFSGLATIIPYEGVTASLRLLWQDSKIVPLYDPSYNQVRWHEPGVITMDAALSYKFLEHYQVWLRVENLFDERYTESGYTMPGRWFYGGIKFAF